MKPAATTIDVPPLSLLARAAADTINETDRSIELIFSTGAQVRRFDWDTGEYLEALEISADAIRVARLQTAPLLNAHSAWSVEDQIGTVVPNTFRIENGKAIVRVRFSNRDSVTPIWNDVKDRILQNVSVGYRVHKFEQDDTGAIPVRTAIDWEPYEISMVPMPDDTGARTRKVEDDRGDSNPCLIIRKEPAVNDAAGHGETVAEDPPPPGLGDRPPEPATRPAPPAPTRRGRFSTRPAAGRRASRRWSSPPRRSRSISAAGTATTRQAISRTSWPTSPTKPSARRTTRRRRRSRRSRARSTSPISNPSTVSRWATRRRSSR